MNNLGLRRIMLIKEWGVNNLKTGKMNQFLYQVSKIVANNLVLFLLNVMIAGIGIFILPSISVFSMYSTISPIKEILVLWALTIPLTLYLLSGYLLLPTKYIFTDFISVILFGLIGVMIWVDCIIRPPSNVLNSPWWGYIFYTAGMGGAYDILVTKTESADYLRILYSIIPVLLSFCGLEIKRYNKKHLDYVVIIKSIVKK